jgi:hypothetical protein
MARVALFSKVLDWVVDLPKTALEIFPIRKKEKISSMLHSQLLVQKPPPIGKTQ